MDSRCALEACRCLVVQKYDDKQLLANLAKHSRPDKSAVSSRTKSKLLHRLVHPAWLTGVNKTVCGWGRHAMM
jgi:hypothetical protein